MILRRTKPRRGITIILSEPEAQRLVHIAASGKSLDSFGHSFRREFLPRLSDLAYGDRELWRRWAGEDDQHDMSPMSDIPGMPGMSGMEGRT